MPRAYAPNIGVIGTGGISASHLDAYRTANWNVTALWNRTAAKARAKAEEYCPNAEVALDWRDIVSDPAIQVVDITLHPAQRVEIIEAAIQAGKHVLSQKPFVNDLETGRRLVDMAQSHGVKLAVNQNARWAPHFAYIREAVRAGLIGELTTCHCAIHWDHGWTAGTPFDEIDDLVLYDFGVHWFDFVSSLFGERVRSVFASASHARGQANKVPLLAQALIEMDGGQASLSFDAATATGARDATVVCGTAGIMTSDGPDLGSQQVRLQTVAGLATPKLEGAWFNDGFRGAMGELLCAIEDDREPLNSARENLRSLGLTFAAVKSRRTGEKVDVPSPF
jgi:predicted dehydrogenase